MLKLGLGQAGAQVIGFQLLQESCSSVKHFRSSLSSQHQRLEAVLSHLARSGYQCSENADDDVANCPCTWDLIEHPHSKYSLQGMMIEVLGQPLCLSNTD